LTAFRLGLNYWPARTAMGWWSAFDIGEVRADFERIALAGFDCVRLFLTWEDFQPSPNELCVRALERLMQTLDCARDLGLDVMPTLFTGHMSGVNWIPAWALGGDAGDSRFRVVSGKRVVETGLRNWFTDPLVGAAQERLAKDLARAVGGHPALFAWDLGNENSNCVIPPTRASGREWLLRITGAIRDAAPGALVTIGLHMEDLENDRKLGPAQAAEACDFLTMHGYPGYASWARGPTDEYLLPFLARVTRWLGNGKPVLFSEFGVPTRADESLAASPLLVPETEALAYLTRALDALHACGCTGAMLWCHSDYAQSSWSSPPLDQAIHERFFGLWRADATPKPTLEAIGSFGRREQTPPNDDTSFIDIDSEAFHLEPKAQLVRLYRRFLVNS
jgi:endo-1,4-beta-mannosidase